MTDYKNTDGWRLEAIAGPEPEAHTTFEGPMPFEHALASLVTWPNNICDVPYLRHLEDNAEIWIISLRDSPAAPPARNTVEPAERTWCIEYAERGVWRFVDIYTFAEFADVFTEEYIAEMERKRLVILGRPTDHGLLTFDDALTQLRTLNVSVDEHRLRNTQTAEFVAGMVITF